MALTGHTEWARTSAGSIIAGAAVEVRRTADNSLATLYTDVTGSTLINNGVDFVSDENGRYEFYTEPDRYYILVGVGASQVNKPLDLTDGRAQVPWPSRAQAVTDIAGGFEAADGTIKSDGTVFYIAKAGETVISDMPGWLPFGRLSSLHFKENTTPGTTDMTSAVQSALAYGSTIKQPVQIKGAQAFSSRITIPNDTGLAGDNEHEDYLYALASGFTNTDVTAPIGDANLCLDFSGETGGAFTPKENQTWRGVGLVYETTEGRVVNAAQAQNCKNFNVDKIRFEGFPTGRLLKCGTLTGDWSITRVEARDCTNSTAHVGGTATNMQITAVELDNDITNSVLSTSGTIRSVYGYNLRNLGAAATLAGGMQSDVVNVQRGDRHHIEDIHGEDVGEVVDTFANKCTGGGFRGVRTEGSVLKAGHGASWNTFYGVSGEDCGQQVVVFFEGNGGYLSQATAGNRVYGVSATDIDPDGVYGGSYTTACVRFDGGGGGVGCYDNAVYGLNADPGVNGRYAVHAESDTERNLVEVNSFVTGTDGIFNGPVTVKLAVPSNVVARNSGTQSVPVSTPTVVNFGTVIYDARGDYSSPTFTAPIAGRYSIDATVEFNANTSGNIAIYVGGVEIERDSVSVAAENPTFSISRTMDMSDGDTLTIAVLQTNGTRNITATSGRTKFSARMVV